MTAIVALTATTGNFLRGIPCRNDNTPHPHPPYIKTRGKRKRRARGFPAGQTAGVARRQWRRQQGLVEVCRNSLPRPVPRLPLSIPMLALRANLVARAKALKWRETLFPLISNRHFASPPPRKLFLASLRP